MSTKLASPYVRCITPQIPKLTDFNGILLVGEAPGGDEEKTGKPFMGLAGHLLDELLFHAGIERERCAITNVFHVRPENNKIHTFFTADEAEGGMKQYPYGFVNIRKELVPEIKRLSEEIQYLGDHVKVIVALGNTAFWALTGKTGISKQRGLMHTFAYGDNACLLVPTFHPAYLLHKNSPAEKALVVQDLKLAVNSIEKV